MGRITDDPSTWGTENSIVVNGRSIPVFNKTESQRTLLRDSLAVLPEAHAALVNELIVGDELHGDVTEGGATVPARNGLPMRMEITACAFTDGGRICNLNGTDILITVLHEAGHHVDAAYRVQGRLSDDEKTTLCDWLVNDIHYRGRHDYHPEDPHRRWKGLAEGVAEVYRRIYGGLTCRSDVRRMIMRRL